MTSWLLTARDEWLIYMVKEPKKTLFKVGIVMAVLVGLLVTSRILPLSHWMEQFTDWLKIHGVMGILVFVVAYVLGTALGAPAGLFIIAATISFGIARGFLIAWLSCLLASAISLAAARYFFRSSIEKMLARNERLRVFDAMIAGEGWKIILLLRLTPVLPFSVCNYFIAMTQIRFWPYMAATAFGVIPATIFYTYLGYVGKIAFEKHPHTPQEYAFLGLGFFATALVIFYFTRIAKRSLRQMEYTAALASIEAVGGNIKVQRTNMPH